MDELTVLMEPTVCSTRSPASAFPDCARPDILETTTAEAAPAASKGTKEKTITSASCRPSTKAMTRPAKKVETNCRNLPTFSPMASWTRPVSPDIRQMTSPVVVSVSKNAMSCRGIAFKYRPRIRAACRSPAIVQHETSAFEK